jgi:hypothetical protein
MSRPKSLPDHIRHTLNIKPLQKGLLSFREFYVDNFCVTDIPVPPYLRPHIETTAICIGENCNIGLDKVSLHGFTKAVDMPTSSTVKAKKVGVSYCETGFFVRTSHEKKEIKMALDLDRVTFKKCKKGVVAPDTYDIKARNVDLEDVEVGFDIYLSKVELLKMGLPENTPVELVSEAIEIVRNSEATEVVEHLSKSKLLSWLGIASNTITVATPIVQALIVYAAASA